MQLEQEWSRGFMVSLYLVDFIGAGDRDRTGDIQLGMSAVNWKQRT
jgi:hypothetical protein